MTVAWSGADPSSFHDAATDYEMGNRWLVNQDISITQLRVWGTGTSAALTNRRGYIRTTADVILSTIVLPDTIPAGWNSYNLPSPLLVDAGSSIWADFGTLEDYGAVVPGGFPRSSSDSGVTVNLGGFNATVGNLPTTTGTTFYGVDFVYDLVPSTAPIVGISLSRSGLTVQATLTIEDDHPDAVTYSIEWGDGVTSGVSGLGPHSHTYAAAGVYAVLVIATDQDGETDAAVAMVTVLDPAGINVHSIRQALADAVDAISGVKCYAYVPNNFTAPAFVVGEVAISYNQSYGGLNDLLITCFMYVSPSTDRSGQLALDGYIRPTGDGSVKAAIEATRNPGIGALSGTADDVHVVRVTGYRQYSPDGDQTRYYGAEFTVHVIG